MEEEEGISFGEICAIIGKRIWLLLAVAAAATAVICLLTVFVINPLTVTYSLEFSIVYPESDTLKYPDGTPFYYRALISASALEAAKATDSRFASIDIEKMLGEDDINISAETDGTVTYTGVYTITMKGSYFSSKTVAADFIRAVASVPIAAVKAQAAEIDYQLEYEIFTNASYGDGLALLSEWKDTLLAQYDEWIELYRENYTVLGKTLKNYRAELSAIFSVSTSEALLEELEDCGYVPVEKLEARIQELEAEKLVNERMIELLNEAIANASATPVSVYAAYSGENDALSSSDSSVSSSDSDRLTLSETLAQLIVRNVQIDYMIEMLTEENVLAYEAKLNAEYEKLATAAETVKAVSSALYTQESEVSFSTSKVVEDNDVSPIMIGVAGCILSFLIAAAVVCAVDFRKMRGSGSKT